LPFSYPVTGHVILMREPTFSVADAFAAIIDEVIALHTGRRPVEYIITLRH
jgi:hypothetical protein